MSGKIFGVGFIAGILIASLGFSVQSPSNCPACEVVLPSCPVSSPDAAPPKLGSSAVVAANSPLKIMAAPTSSMFDIPESILYVVIDVGTNIDGEFAPICARDPKCFYVAVEPLTGERTMRHTCDPDIAKGHAASATWKQRCMVLTAAVAPKVGWATFRVAVSTECSSLSAGGTTCGKLVSAIKVPLIPLDDIIDMIPRNLPIKMISLDCQGNDFDAASSLRRNRDRVANMIAEAQDLPLKDKMWIYQNDHNKNAGHLKACMTQKWGWRETGSAWNTDFLREVNIHFSNPSHPLSECKEENCKIDWNSQWRHPRRVKVPLKYDDGKCPDENF